MAMKIKQLINSLLLIVNVMQLLHFSVAPIQEDYTLELWRRCENIIFRNDSTFQHNLNHVLDSLVGNVSSSGFYTSSVDEGQNSNSTVYGLVQCRGDLGSSDCKVCAATAKAKLVQDCYNTSAFIHLNGCFLRYDSYNFYDDNSYSSMHAYICNQGNTNNASLTIDAMAYISNTSNKALESPKLFAADSMDVIGSPSYKIYNIAQCTRDMFRDSCSACLAYGLSRFLSGTGCKLRTLGARFLSSNCQLRFDTFPFFDVSILSPVPAPPPSSGGEECPPMANLELIFKYDILREATSNFKEGNKLGQGGFGSVYKGNLPDGRVVAIKRLRIGSSQGDAEFLNEANLISCIQHRNLVKLLGCSFKSSERLLVYEYLPNSSLDKILFDTTKRHLLSWHQRYEIIVGTARGLAYLHEESDIRIIHRDIKASNILLDNKLRPKIADFGLAKFFTEDISHVTTGIAGTIGYMAPEYALRGQLTQKADVFGFGVLVLETLSGRKNRILAQEELLIEGTWRLYKAEKGLEIMDPTLQGSYSWEEGIRVLKIGLLCTQASAALRPSMSRVVSMLTSEREHLPSPKSPAFTELDNVGIPDQVERPRVIDPHKTSSSNWSSKAATYSRKPSDIHSAAADPSSGNLDPR